MCFAYGLRLRGRRDFEAASRRKDVADILRVAGTRTYAAPCRIDRPTCELNVQGFYIGDNQIGVFASAIVSSDGVALHLTELHFVRVEVFRLYSRACQF